VWLPSSQPKVTAADKADKELLSIRFPLQKSDAVAIQSGLDSLNEAKTARTFSSVEEGASSNVNAIRRLDKSMRETSTFVTSQKLSVWGFVVGNGEKSNSSPKVASFNNDSRLDGLDGGVCADGWLHEAIFIKA